MAVGTADKSGPATEVIRIKQVLISTTGHPETTMHLRQTETLTGKMKKLKGTIQSAFMLKRSSNVYLFSLDSKLFRYDS